MSMSTASPIVEYDMGDNDGGDDDRGDSLLLERAVDTLTALESREQERKVKVEEEHEKEEEGGHEENFEDEEEEEEGSCCEEELGTTPRAPAAIVSFGPSLANYGKQRSMFWFEDAYSTSPSAVGLTPQEEEERRRRREQGLGGGLDDELPSWRVKKGGSGRGCVLPLTIAVARMKAMLARSKRRRGREGQGGKDGEGKMEDEATSEGNTHADRADNNGSGSSSSIASSNGYGRRGKRGGVSQKNSNGTLSTMGAGEEGDWVGEDGIEEGAVGEEEGVGAGRWYRYFWVPHSLEGEEEVKGDEEGEEEEEGVGEGRGKLPGSRFRRQLSV
ncbi:Hypothetical protein NocV09_00200350 [Nannochloropsis oceanica]